MGWLEREIALSTPIAGLRLSFAPEIKSPVELTEFIVVSKFTEALYKTCGRKISGVIHYPFQNGHDCEGVENREKVIFEVTAIGDPRRTLNAYDDNCLSGAIVKKLNGRYSSVDIGKFILLVYHPYFVRNYIEFLTSPEKSPDLMVSVAKDILNKKNIPFDEIWFMQLRIGRRKTEVSYLENIFVYNPDYE